MNQLRRSCGRISGSDVTHGCSEGIFVNSGDGRACRAPTIVKLRRLAVNIRLASRRPREEGGGLPFTLAGEIDRFAELGRFEPDPVRVAEKPGGAGDLSAVGLHRQANGRSALRCLQWLADSVRV